MTQYREVLSSSISDMLTTHCENELVTYSLAHLQPQRASRLGYPSSRAPNCTSRAPNCTSRAPNCTSRVPNCTSRQTWFTMRPSKPYLVTSTTCMKKGTITIRLGNPIALCQQPLVGMSQASQADQEITCLHVGQGTLYCRVMQ